MISIKSAGELLEISVRGALADAFKRQDIEPNAEQWEMLRGEREITLRDLGNLSCDLGLDLSQGFSFTPIQTSAREGGK